MPPSCQAACQAYADFRDTRNARATCGGFMPREQAAARRCEVMFTGSGGDEINAHHSRTQTELPTPEPVPWLGVKAARAVAEVNEHLAPIPVLPVPTLMAFGMHTPGFLRAGIWPVSPLVHPRIVRFMEQLPHEHKRGKALFRDRIRRAGVPEWVAASAEPENFWPFWKRACVPTVCPYWMTC